MTTAYDYRMVKDVEYQADKIGLKLVTSKFGNNQMALIPKGDCLPVYTRDTELTVGSIEELESVMRGWRIASMYFHSLRLVNDAKIKKAEDLYRQDMLAYKLKTGANLPKEK